MNSVNMANPKKKRLRICESSEDDEDSRTHEPRLQQSEEDTSSSSSDDASSEEDEPEPIPKGAKLNRVSAATMSKKMKVAKPSNSSKSSPHESWKGADLVPFSREKDGPIKSCFHIFASPSREKNATQKMKKPLGPDRRLICCNFCGDVLTLQIAKGLSSLKKHIATCKGPGAKKFYHQLLLGPVASSDSSTAATTSTESPPKPNQKQSSLNNHFVLKNKKWSYMDKKMKRQTLLCELTKWVVMRSEPFNHVKDDHFRDIIACMDPSAPSVSYTHLTLPTILLV